MRNRIETPLRRRSVGDTAVDGLLAGLLPGLVMLVYLIVAGWIAGEGATAVVGRFDPTGAGVWFSGLWAHLAVSAIYGLVFALGMSAVTAWRPVWGRFGWLAGVLMGLLTFAIGRGVILPAMDSSLMQLATLNLLVAHLGYGILLGIRWPFGRFD